MAWNIRSLALRRWGFHHEEYACFATEKALAAVVILVVGGCTTVAQVTTLSDQNCRHTFMDRVSSILVEQGEMQEVADNLPTPPRQYS